MVRAAEIRAMWSHWRQRLIGSWGFAKGRRSKADQASDPMIKDIARDLRLDVQEGG